MSYNFEYQIRFKWDQRLLVQNCSHRWHHWRFSSQRKAQNAPWCLKRARVKACRYLSSRLWAFLNEVFMGQNGKSLAIPNTLHLSRVWTNFVPITLKSGLDKRQGVNVRPGNFGKNNKRRVWNKHRAWNKCRARNKMCKLMLKNPKNLKISVAHGKIW